MDHLTALGANVEVNMQDLKTVFENAEKMFAKGVSGDTTQQGLHAMGAALYALARVLYDRMPPQANSEPLRDE